MHRSHTHTHTYTSVRAHLRNKRTQTGAQRLSAFTWTRKSFSNGRCVRAFLAHSASATVSVTACACVCVCALDCGLLCDALLCAFDMHLHTCTPAEHCIIRCLDVCVVVVIGSGYGRRRSPLLLPAHSLRHHFEMVIWHFRPPPSPSQTPFSCEHTLDALSFTLDYFWHFLFVSRSYHFRILNFSLVDVVVSCILLLRVTGSNARCSHYKSASLEFCIYNEFRW